jgi:hypothetical protein
MMITILLFAGTSYVRALWFNELIGLSEHNLNTCFLSAWDEPWANQESSVSPTRMQIFHGN